MNIQCGLSQTISNITFYLERLSYLKPISIQDYTQSFTYSGYYTDYSQIILELPSNIFWFIVKVQYRKGCI